MFMEFIRLLFLIRHWHLAPGIPMGDIAASFLLGMKFDMAMLSYAILPFFVISILPVIGFRHSIKMRRISLGIFFAILSLVFLLCLIDIEYYGQFGEHLGVWFYSYLDNFGLVWYGVSSDFPVGLYAILWFLVTAVFLAAALKIGKVIKRNERAGWISRSLYYPVSLLLLAVAMRGSLSLAPLDWGSAYHSNFGFANDLALNGIFTLSHSLYEDYAEKSSPGQFEFLPPGEPLKTVQATLAAPGDSLLDPEKSLLRLSRFDGPAVDNNIVIIILESWTAKFVGVLGGHPDATPFFDSLSQNSLLFENFYASGLRTNRGLLSTLCSFPSLPGRTVMKRYGAPHPFTSIADILGKRGYESYFIYGGDLGFENMEGFFRNQGFENFTGIDNFPLGSALNKWGVPDHLVLERANRIFGQSKEPFLGVVVTLTNHEPFKLPGKEFEVFPESVEYHDYLNTFHYSDWSLGYFFHQAEKEPYFKNTIFVLVGDHGKMINKPDDMQHNFRIACLIYCPGREDIEPRKIETVCGQTDLLPTILGLLGKPAIHQSWGRDLLAPENENRSFAFLNRNEGYGWVEDSLIVRENPGAPARLCRFPSDSLCINDISQLYPDVFQRMRRRGAAMLQLEVEMVHVRQPE
jgi:phosphoglycerol transferase MdoB-like AlkP superfamily enzyme